MSSILKNYVMKTGAIPQTHFNGETEYYLPDSNTITIDNLVVNGELEASQIKITTSLDMSGAKVISALDMSGNSIINADIQADSIVSNSIVNSGSISSGALTDVSGGEILINGSAGLGRVYDEIYNRPVAGAEILSSTFNNVGTAIALTPFTPTNTGLYTITMEVKVDTNGLGWTNGTSLILGYLANNSPPFALLSDSFLACDSLANPALFIIPSGFATGTYAKDIVAVVSLTAGVEYLPSISVSNGGINLGATGGIRFFVQPLLA